MFNLRKFRKNRGFDYAVNHHKSGADGKNCTIAFNYKDGSQNGIGIIGRANTQITKCIIWGHTYELSSCQATFCCIEEGTSGIGNIDSEPKFKDPDSDDYRLKSDSLCIDAGEPWADFSNEPCPKTLSLGVAKTAKCVGAMSSC